MIRYIMSYISFNSKDPNCIFSNNFNEDFVIEPDSKVGLVNFKFQPIEPVFDKTINNLGQEFSNVIRIGLSDETNDIFNIIIKDIAQEDPDEVNPTNLENHFILPEIGYQINNQIDISVEKTLGIEFKCDMNSAPQPNKVNFKFKTFPYINPKNFFILEDVTFTEVTDEYKLKTGLASINLDVDNRRKMYCPDPFTRGVGFFRMRIDNFTVPNIGNANVGFTIALVDRDPINFVNDTLQQNIVIGVNLPCLGHNYRYIDDDEYTVSAVAPANINAGGSNNDVVEIRRNGGKLQCVVYQANGVEHLLFEKTVSGIGGYIFDNASEENFFPVIFFGANDATMTLSNPRVHLSPYNIISEYEAPLQDAGIYGSVNPLIPSSAVNTSSTFSLEFTMVLDSNISLMTTTGDTKVNGSSIYRYNFASPDTTQYDTRKNLGRFLGFQTREYFINAVHAGGFSADNDWLPTFTSKMYYLQAQNLELDTYSSIGKGKKNILLPMPLYNRFSNKFITYEPNNLYMVKLKNSHAMTMRNFRFRLLDENLEPVSVVGNSHMTIVID